MEEGPEALSGFKHFPACEEIVKGPFKGENLAIVNADEDVDGAEVV